MQASTVMLWGGQTETEEVLKAVFEPRGYTIRRWSQKASAGALSTMESHPPQLLVVDQNDVTVPPCDRWSETPRIIIGKYSAPRAAASGDACPMLSHPFDYRELVRAIESML